MWLKSSSPMCYPLAWDEPPCHECIGLCTKSHRTVRSGPLRSAWFVLLREISCNFVDRLLRIRSHTIHEITLNSTKEHEIRVFVQSQCIETFLWRPLTPPAIISSCVATQTGPSLNRLIICDGVIAVAANPSEV